MSGWLEQLRADKTASTVLVLFIPSVDRDDEPVHQERWVTEALSTCGRLFGGATAFPQGRGVWRDDARGGRLVYDEPVIVQCYTSEDALNEKASDLKEFLHRMGRGARQGAVGFVVDRHYLEIEFPLEEDRHG